MRAKAGLAFVVLLSTWTMVPSAQAQALDDTCPSPGPASPGQLIPLGDPPFTSRPPQGYFLIVGTEGPDVLIGTPGSDYILGLGGTDVLCGHGGGDHLFGGSGNDVLYGGPGQDRLLGEEGNDVLFGDAGDERPPATINAFLRGEGGFLSGGSGNDVLFGGTGADDLTGGPEFDACSGGPDQLGSSQVSGCEILF